MPKSKHIPKLKTLALQKLAWPDAVQKNEHEMKQFPTVESYIRHTLLAKYFYDEKVKYKTRRKHNISTPKEPMREITEDVINAWIRLSNYFETNLNEIDSMSMFMHMSTIGKLDFLHEGFTLRDEKDFFHKILPYIGLVPHSLRPQKIDYRTWFDLVNVFVQEGVVETLEHLFIFFGNDKIKREKTPPAIDIESPSAYRFEETLENFVHLKSIVVRGEIVQDNFMLAVGENCYFLEYLDIRGTRVTERGVGLLLFQKLGKRFFKGAFLPAHHRFSPFPPEIMRPCCATLNYLDVSEILFKHHPSTYDMYITKACPQLRSTPLKFYYNVPGTTRVVLTDFSDGFGLGNFRQRLVNYMRSGYCDSLFEFVQVILGCIHFEDPRLEIMENEYGEETSFLFLSGSAVLIHCELQHLTVLTLVSYARNKMNCIPISLISKFAPSLQKLKSSLKGTLVENTAMKHLKYLTIPAVQCTDTIKSVLEFCPALQYFEVQDIIRMNTATQFGNSVVEKLFPRDPGNSYEKLEVLQFLFKNQVTVHPGLSWIIARCPGLRIVGDLEFWGTPFDTCMRIFSNTSFYDYDFAIEYKGILHFCGKGDKRELARFE